MDEAPLWFQVYAAQALLRHNELHNELVNGLAMTFNRTSQRSQEAIKPLLDVNGCQYKDIPVRSVTVGRPEDPLSQRSRKLTLEDLRPPQRSRNLSLKDPL